VITCVTFDVWNTIARIEVVYRRLASEISTYLGKPLEVVLKEILDVYSKAKELRRKAAFEEHRVVEESCVMMARSLGINVSKLKDVIAKVFYELDPKEVLFEDTLDTMHELKNKGLKIGIIGNTLFWPSALTRLILVKSGISTYIDYAIFSDEVGICKPDRRIFLKALEALGSEASTSVHVGDGIVEDVGGALSVGMNAILINRSSLSSAVIRELRVAIVKSLSEVPKVIEDFA